MSWRYHQKLQQQKQDELLMQQQSDVDNQQINILQDNNQEDPYELFMNGLQNQVKIEKNQTKKYNIDDQQQLQNEGYQDDQIEQFKNGNQQQEILQNQQHEFLQAKPDKKIIQALKPFDFSNVQLQDFNKNFYQEHEEIKNLSQLQVKKILKQLQIKISGANIPRPIVSFGHLPFDQNLKNLIVKNQLQKPTPIQSIALPAALSGRDVVGIAKTGSGKTLAYVWPMIVHVMNQTQTEKADGPIAIVLAPTRQLCQQIYIQTKKYSKKLDIKIACLLGGQNKHQQWKILKAGIDVLIASPGRLIQMIKKKATNLIRVTYLVIDEADRMLSLGFQQQIRSIVNQTRQDRQTLLFTATMKKSMQILANDVVNSPIRINIGQQGAANENIKQEVVIVQQRYQKFQWLQIHLKQIISDGKVLIFANQKQVCQQIGKYIEDYILITPLILYGSKSQYERTIIMNSFKNQSPILIATDIAARGIDVKNIKVVINFQCPKQVEAYIHRIGRAGRAAETGISYTFLTSNDIKFAIGLVNTFQNSGYSVPQQLQDLACLDDFFKRKRLSSKMGVSFAKGKDASKFLNQIIKKQRMGYNKAGLGMQQPNVKSSYSKSSSNILTGEVDTGNLSISQISAMIRKKHEDNINREQKFGQFYLSNKNDLNDGCKQVQVVFSKIKKQESLK